MKKKVGFLLATVLCTLTAFGIAACNTEEEYAVTFSFHEPAVVTVTDAAGNTVESGAKIKNGTVLTVTVDPVEGHTATVKANGVKQTVANHKASVKVKSDTVIDVSQAANEHTVTFTVAHEAVISVKNGETALTSGGKAKYGDTLTIAVTHLAAYTPIVKINNAEVALVDGKIEHTVRGDVSISADQELKYDAAGYARTGHTAFDGAYLWTGSFEGAVDGADMQPNITLNYDLKTLKADDKYTRAFKVTQISGTAGNTQLLAYDGDYQNTAGDAQVGVYWDVLNNWDALSDNGIDASAAMTKLYEDGDYMGYWGSVKGNTYNAELSSKSGDFQFLAANAGQYLLTADILKLAGDGHEKISSYTVLINVVAADAQKTLTIGTKKDTTTGKWNYAGSYLGTAGGDDITENVEFRYDLTRSDTDPIQFLPLFKVEKIAGGDAAKTQLLVYDTDVSGGTNGIYYDVLNNWAAIAEIGAAQPEGTNLTLNAALAAKTGYRGYWGSAIVGNTLNPYAEGTNQKKVMVKMPYHFELIAEEAGEYLVTVDFVKYATGFEKLGSYSVLVKASSATVNPAARMMPANEIHAPVPVMPQIKAPAPAIKPAPQVKTPAPAVKPAPQVKTPAPAVKPAPQVKTPAPAVKPAPKMPFPKLPAPKMPSPVAPTPKTK